MSASSPTVASIEHLDGHVGQTVELRGWVHNRTSKGKLHFVILRDGTGYVQCVLKKNQVGDELFESIGGASQESSLILVGEVRADDRAPGGYEISVSGGHVLQSTSDFIHLIAQARRPLEVSIGDCFFLLRVEDIRFLPQLAHEGMCAKQVKESRVQGRRRPLGISIFTL